ncbi:hypothetical protein [Roseivirga misakiensis]|uniref:Uncharacterized protein n=1 Tax=Roseivirga misakiensis TaxID=1563681 RepID=A0A1E5T7T7_9BACT|nr:hypothetical protein [Roseivirga misakiensis]OEK07442.1 hypothetical protein BFP71_00085 [Roseivirga misakiensis]
MTPITEDKSEKRFTNIWGFAYQDNTSLSYQIRRIWRPLFELIGLETNLTIQLNNLVDFKIETGRFGSRLIIQTHLHKSNKKINPIESNPIWLPDEKFLNALTDKFEYMIELNKQGKNIALICVNPSSISEFYEARDSKLEKSKVSEFASYKSSKQHKRAFELSIKSEKKLNEMFR